MLGKLICFITRKHKRGKFLRAEDNGRTKVFACPRCNRETRYSVKTA